MKLQHLQDILDQSRNELNTENNIIKRTGYKLIGKYKHNIWNAMHCIKST